MKREVYLWGVLLAFGESWGIRENCLSLWVRLFFERTETSKIGRLVATGLEGVSIPKSLYAFDPGSQSCRAPGSRDSMPRKTCLGTPRSSRIWEALSLGLDGVLVKLKGRRLRRRIHPWCCLSLVYADAHYISYVISKFGSFGSRFDIPQHARHVAHHSYVFSRKKMDRDAFPSKSSSTTNTMDMVVTVCRQIMPAKMGRLPRAQAMTRVTTLFSVCAPEL